MEKLYIDVLLFCMKNSSLRARKITKSSYWSNLIRSCLGARRPIKQWPLVPKLLGNDVLNTCKFGARGDSFIATAWWRPSSITCSSLSSMENFNIGWPRTISTGFRICFWRSWAGFVYIQSCSLWELKIRLRVCLARVLIWLSRSQRLGKESGIHGCPKSPPYRLERGERSI